jgi:Fe-S-cluster containining protein
MAEGMRFECQPGCTACCTQRGFVYLSEADLDRAAAFLGMSAAAFEHRYVFRTPKRRRLRIPRDSRNCYFLNAGGCSIHPAKPTQCRIFPFWPELVESRREWKKTARYCPGMGKGPLVQIETAQAQAQEMRAAYPEMY